MEAVLDSPAVLANSREEVWSLDDDLLGAGENGAGLVEEFAQPVESDSGRLQAFLATLPDLDIHEFLANQVDKESTVYDSAEDNEGDTSSLIKIQSQYLPKGGGERVTLTEGRRSQTFDCPKCGANDSPWKLCTSCGKGECRLCLMEGQGWTDSQLEKFAWVCTVCNDRDFSDVMDDAVSLCFLKTGMLPLGMTKINRARVRRVCKRYRWDKDLELLLKSASWALWRSNRSKSEQES